MARISISIGTALLFVIGLFIWLAPISIQAAGQPDQGTQWQLNSEGDEWVQVSPQQTTSAPPDPDVTLQNESEVLPPLQPAPILPGPEVDLGLELDKARQLGPEAVLRFVASQPDPGLPLMQAAMAEAHSELAAPRTHSPAVPQEIWVAVNGGPCTFSTMQEAINAAASGATLLAASGAYTESFDVAGKALTIVGGYNATCTSPLPDGITEVTGSTTGSVVDVSGGSVLVLRTLDISGGTSFGAGVDVLGSSKVTLDHTDVHDNAGASGGGLYIGGGSAITVTNDADIYNNTATGLGGGAIVYGSLYGYHTASDFYGNSSSTDGGGIAINNGTVVLDNADVLANTAIDEGGGIYLVNGRLTLTNSSYVGETERCCQSAANGGGIYASGGQIFLNGATTTVMNNTATGNGGGLYLVNGARLTVSGSQIGHPGTASGGNDAVMGAGMYVDGSQVIFNGLIINNIATNSGGGIYATNSSITMTQSTVGGRGANLHNRIGAAGLNGAGMYLINNTRARLDQTTIISNTMSNPNTGYGGGVYIRQGSVLTMTHSRVEEHRLPSTIDGRGAGMYIYDATVSLTDTVVANNTAGNFAGGARLFGTSTLNLRAGSQFSGNRALNGNGGAIAATNTAAINIKDSTILQNQANGSGGGIYLDAGNVSFTGAWTVSDNSASGDGGALAVMGTGTARFSATNGPGTSSISNNHAGGHGGAVYLGNASTMNMYATSGYPLAIQSNTAGQDGGAAYAGGGGFFDIYGDVSASNNSAVGNGGAFYLSGGSRFWMDDYFNISPAVYANSAANGGAIYALNSPRVECDGVQFGSSANGNIASAGSGGALYLNSSTLSADNCGFHSNQALNGNGGAIAAVSSSVNIFASFPRAPAQQTAFTERAAPDAPLATPCIPAERDCSRMVLNTASGDGGALYSNNSNMTVGHTIFDQNTANRGGAIYQAGTAAVSEITNVLAARNTSIQAFGAGIRQAAGAMTIRHATLAHNTGGAGFSPGSPVTASIYNSIIWGNTVAAFGALTAAECNIDQGSIAGPANNPQFLAPAAGVYRPGPGSPAVNACATGLANDLLGAARPVGPQFDMGAYEVLPPLSLPLILK